MISEYELIFPPLKVEEPSKFVKRYDKPINIEAPSL